MPDLDRDRILALSYIAPARRVGVEALWQLDAALGAVLAGGREPLISQIKLTWWRDALERLDHAPAPAEPALRAAAERILPHRVSGADLSAMEAGWTALLGPALTAEELDLYAAARGGLLFRYSARLLGGESGGAVERAGEAWALIDLARHSATPAESDAAVAAARSRLEDTARLRWPSPLRPLGMLAALAARDAEAATRWEDQGSPRRMLRMLRHRLTGV